MKKTVTKEQEEMVNRLMQEEIQIVLAEQRDYIVRRVHKRLKQLEKAQQPNEETL